MVLRTYLVYNTVVPEKKVLVVCLAGGRLLLRLEKKSSSRLSGGCVIGSDLREIIRFLREIECIEFE